MRASAASGASRATLPRRSEVEPFWNSFSHGLRPWFFSQFQLSFFRRRVGPVATAQVALSPAHTIRGELLLRQASCHLLTDPRFSPYLVSESLILEERFATGLWPGADFAGGAGTRRGSAGKESGNRLSLRRNSRRFPPSRARKGRSGGTGVKGHRPAARRDGAETECYFIDRGLEQCSCWMSQVEPSLRRRAVHLPASLPSSSPFLTA